MEGKDGLQKLRSKIKVGGPFVLYHGALGAMSATFVGHYPWFYTYNKLNEALPTYDRKTNLPMFLARNAAIGFCCSAISDTCSNSIRVIKTTKQVCCCTCARPPPACGTAGLRDACQWPHAHVHASNRALRRPSPPPPPPHPTPTPGPHPTARRRLCRSRTCRP